MARIASGTQCYIEEKMAEQRQAPIGEASLSLDTIGRRCGTDKSSEGHDYLSFYERFFSSLRYERAKILEVGVFKGASLKTWERYFPHASIVGVDINPEAQKFASDRISIENADQSNIQDLVDIGVRHGPFDIIIEDGSHLWEHQITSLRTLFAFVKNEGFCVVEDLQTNYGQLGVRYKGASMHELCRLFEKIAGHPGR